MYDNFVRKRNAKVVSAAARSNAIISSLFPANVRQRMFQEADEKKSAEHAPKSRLKSMMANGDFNTTKEDDIMYKSKPIADLFPETTILFADIAG